MSASLVGSEMCIRDRYRATQLSQQSQPRAAASPTKDRLARLCADGLAVPAVAEPVPDQSGVALVEASQVELFRSEPAATVPQA
eukprot:14473826-Alexandrium_andersonii.AAC.1